MKLSRRDKVIMNCIRKQDFCFFKDITRFFPSYSTASRRLKELSRYGYLIIEDIQSKRFKNILDRRSLSIIGANRKIIYLKKSHLSNWEHLRQSRFKINHQVLLFSLKDQLEKVLHCSAVFENEIKERRRTLESGDHEPYPDFYLKGDEFKLAVELELHVKSKNRYDLKTVNYNNSSYSHVLYVVGTLKKKNQLLEYFAYKDGIGISHYGEPDTIFSYSYGKLPVLEWLKKGLEE